MIDPVTARHARAVLAAHDERRQIAPLSEGEPALDLPGAYRVAAQVRRLREARGERPVGRKVGFTNRRMWDAHGVRAPIWSHVYDATLREAAALDAPLPLDSFVEPRIEPEVAFGLRAAPEPGMDAAALIACVDWAAPAFEIVQSLYPGWRFAAADTVAAFGLHGALVLGERRRIAPAAAASWRADLAGFETVLLRDGAEADRGAAEAVLGGGPLAALAHLVALLAGDPAAPPLAAGEVVSTGTLTRALPVAPGQRWAVRFGGVALPDLTIALG